MKVNNLFTLCISFIIMLGNTTTSIAEISRKNTMIWQAALDFNTRFNIRHWTIHHDESIPGDLIRHISKDIRKSLIYVSFKEGSMKEKEFLRHDRMIHLYLSKNFEPLKELLKSEYEYSMFDPKGKNTNMGSNCWIIYIPDEHTQRTATNALEEAKLRLDSLVFEFRRETKENDNYESITVQDVYKTEINSNNILKAMYGEWNSESKFSIIEQDIWKRRADLQGHNLRIVTNFWRKDQTYVEDGCQSYDCFKGIQPEIFAFTQLKLNFTFTLKVDDVLVTGQELESGYWSGMIGQTLKGESDFIVDNFVISQERMKVMDYAIVYGSYMARIYIQVPGESIEGLSYTKPFRRNTWIVIGLSFFLVPIITWILMYYRRKAHNGVWSLSYCYYLIYSQVTKTYNSTKIEKTRGQTLIVSVAFGVMFIFWIWEAELIAYFVIPVKVFSFKTLKEFLTKTDKKLIVEKGTITEYIFRGSKDPVMQEIWKHRVLPYLDDPVYKLQACDQIDVVAKDDSYAAFQLWNSYYKGYAKVCEKYHKCEVVHSPAPPFKNFGGGWIFPKKSPFYHLFKKYISIAHETGIVSRIMQSYDELKALPNQECENFDGKPLGYHKPFMIFGIMMIGFGLSLITFVIEMIMPLQWTQRRDIEEENGITRCLRMMLY